MVYSVTKNERFPIYNYGRLENGNTVVGGFYIQGFRSWSKLSNDCLFGSLAHIPQDNLSSVTNWSEICKLRPAMENGPNHEQAEVLIQIIVIVTPAKWKDKSTIKKAPILSFSQYTPNIL